MNIDAKVSEIKLWLATMSDDLKDKPFEVTEFTVEYLYQLMQLNKAQDNHASLQIKDYESKTAEFSMEAKRLGNQLSALGIEEAELESSTKEELNELANLGNALLIEDPSIENYMMAVSDITIEDYELEDELQRLRKAIKDIEGKYEHVCGEVEKLSQSDIAESRKAESHQEEFDMSVKLEAVKSQIKSYASSTKELKRQLQSSGIKKEFTHEQLISTAESITVLEAEISDIQKKLQAFRDLPTNLPQTKERIRMVQLEIDAMEQEFPFLQNG